jgi:hypothetical protein
MLTSPSTIEDARPLGGNDDRRPLLTEDDDSAATAGNVVSTTMVIARAAQLEQVHTVKFIHTPAQQDGEAGTYTFILHPYSYVSDCVTTSVPVVNSICCCFLCMMKDAALAQPTRGPRAGLCLFGLLPLGCCVNCTKTKSVGTGPTYVHSPKKLTCTHIHSCGTLSALLLHIFTHCWPTVSRSHKPLFFS